MTDNDNVGSTKPQPANEKRRFRSEIEFPYADLKSAVEIAHTIHTKAGSSCDVDELAVWMGKTATERYVGPILVPRVYSA